MLVGTQLLLGSQLGALTAVPLPHPHATREGPWGRSSAAAQAFCVAAVVCNDSLMADVVVGAAGLVCGPPPRTAAPPHTKHSTRRLTVPAAALSCPPKQRRKHLGGSGPFEEPGGDDGSGGFGGDGGGDDPWGPGGGDPWGEGRDHGWSAAGDFLLAWSLFCALAFASTCQHLAAPAKPQPGAVFAGMGYSALKAQLRQLQAACTAA